MKFSTILVIAGIVIAVIGIGIVLMNNTKANNDQINDIQANNGQANEDRFKPRLANLDDATRSASLHNDNFESQRINPTSLILIGIFVTVAGVYDALRTKNSPGETK